MFIVGITATRYPLVMLFMIAAAYHIVDVAIKRVKDEADAIVIGTRRAVWFKGTAIWSIQNIYTWQYCFKTMVLTSFYWMHCRLFPTNLL